MKNGTSYHDFTTVQEPYNRLQSIVSTLSKGPVAPSDKIGESDASLIMKSCTKDGRLLQGDKPAMTLQLIHNRRVYDKDSDSEIWEAKTKLSDMDFAVVMGAMLQEDLSVSISNDLMLTGKYVMYEANDTRKVIQSDTIEFKACKKYDFQVYSLSPVLPNGYALLGEPSKWFVTFNTCCLSFSLLFPFFTFAVHRVPVSRARFSNLEYGTESSNAFVSVIAEGMEGEKIDVAFLAPKSMTPSVVSCVIPRGSKVTVSMSNTGGQCTPL